MPPFVPPDWAYLELRAALHARDGEQASHALRPDDAAAPCIHPLTYRCPRPDRSAP